MHCAFAWPPWNIPQNRQNDKTQKIKYQKFEAIMFWSIALYKIDSKCLRHLFMFIKVIRFHELLEICKKKRINNAIHHMLWEAFIVVCIKASNRVEIMLKVWFDNIRNLNGELHEWLNFLCIITFDLKKGWSTSLEDGSFF